MGNVFKRTACFCKEKRDNGSVEIKRIPWDLIGFNGAGFLVSPMPMPANMFGEATTDTIASDISDMLFDEAQNDLIDGVADIMWFESEADFISKFEAVFGFYISDASKEFGYPCASNL